MSRSIDEKLVATLQKYLEKPRTLEQIIAKSKVSRRTVYRYLARIEGVQVVGITRPTRYVVRQE